MKKISGVAMSEEIVKLKGTRFGLELSFDAETPFPVIEADIRRRLETGSKFFRQGTVIQLAPGILSTTDESILRRLFHQHGVLFRVENVEATQPKRRRQKVDNESTDSKPIEEKKTSTPKVAPIAEEQKMLVINRTVRGGQEIQTAGSVLICGNVNPGAQIIAGGSIDIRGICRGIVHAGAYGDTSAFIIADRLMPVQIRIADRIAQAPDQDVKPTIAERASIHDGKIIIEPIERQEMKL